VTVTTRRIAHVLTPGDHYSPRTGSAIPTVVHGLAGAVRDGERRHVVVLARGTYPDRYDSADIVEYTQRHPHSWDRYVDAGLSRIGLPRAASRASYAAALGDQDSWEPSYVLLHNAPQAVPLVDADRHVPVVYAHNELFRTYSAHEAERTLEHVVAVLCVSEFLAERTASQLPPSLRERVRVVLNGVDTELFHPSDAGRTGSRLELLFVGRMLQVKGPDVALEAVRTLPADLDVHLTLVGSNGFDADDELTPFERSVRRAAADLGDRATVLPFLPRDRVADLMRQADVVLVPSRWDEPFALTALEGLASGAVVVGSRVGGIPEAVGSAGVLVAASDPGALRNALVQIASFSRERRDSLRRDAREWSTTHSWRRSLDTLTQSLHASDD
jgi:glycosyltransferase involved in cell wall biosynthesis